MKTPESPKPVDGQNVREDVQQALPPMTVPIFFSYYCTTDSPTRKQLLQLEKAFLASP